jgi:hypothetical protein
MVMSIRKCSQMLTPGIRLVRKRGSSLAVARVNLCAAEVAATGEPAEYFIIMVKDFGAWCPAADLMKYRTLDSACDALIGA